MGSLLHYTFLLSILLFSVAVLLDHPPTATAAPTTQKPKFPAKPQVGYYTLDVIKSNHSSLNMTRNPKFPKKIKKGQKCTASYGHRFDICNGVSANNGTILLRCCKKRCLNVFTEKKHCGICRNRCRFGQRCCRGKCINILSNPLHCGKCNLKCPRGIACQYGICGYA